jgi:hypothetical protein
MKTSIPCTLIAIAFTAGAARAGEVPVDISSLVNAPWTFSGCDGVIFNGDTFPTGAQNLGGVPFTIPTGPNNAWLGALAADCGAGIVRLTIPVGAQGVTSAFTLLNTFWGAPGPSAYLAVTFTGSDGASVTQRLVGGVNVRDYNNGSFQNIIDNTGTVQVWTNGEGQRLDRQEYILPPAFATQTLTSVTITDTGNEGFSRATFAGLTVSTCGAMVVPGISFSSGPIVYLPDEKVYEQDVYLANGNSYAVAGPLDLIVEDLPAEAHLVNESSTTACYSPIGSPYVVALPKGSSLAPNTELVVTLKFRDPSGAAISYTPLTASSRLGAP